MNTAVVTHIHQTLNAEREQVENEKRRAEQIYWDIIKDPTRTSAKDKAAMTEAMKLLGKTPADLSNDASAVEASHEAAKLAADRHPAQEEVHAAELALLEYHTVTKLAMQQKIAELLKEKSDAVEVAKQRLNTALISQYHLGQIGKKNAHILDHLHPDAAKAMQGHVRINGEIYDPENPRN